MSREKDLLVIRDTRCFMSRVSMVGEVVHWSGLGVNRHVLFTFYIGSGFDVSLYYPLFLFIFKTHRDIIAVMCREVFVVPASLHPRSYSPTLRQGKVLADSTWPEPNRCPLVPAARWMLTRDHKQSCEESILFYFFRRIECWWYRKYVWEQCVLCDVFSQNSMRASLPLTNLFCFVCLSLSHRFQRCFVPGIHS